MRLRQFGIICLAFSSVCFGGTGYKVFLGLWGYQGDGHFVRNAPRLSHTWANVYQCPENFTEISECYIRTISWFSRQGAASITSGRMPGKLYDHEQSLELGRKKGSSAAQICRADSIRVSGYCLNEVEPRLWDLAKLQIDKLQSLADQGRGYEMNDKISSRSELSHGGTGDLNCIHGVTDLATFDGHPLLNTQNLRGFSGSSAALQYLMDRYQFRGPKNSQPAKVASKTPSESRGHQTTESNSGSSRPIDSSESKMTTVLEEWTRKGGASENGLPKIIINVPHPPLTPGQDYLINNRIWKYLSNGSFQAVTS